MQRQRNRFGLGGAVHSALAALLGALFLAVSILSISPSLHQRVHPEPAGAHHICLICAFAKGHVNADTAEQVMPPAPPDFKTHCVILRVSSPSVADYRVSASRAPPAA